MDAMEEFSAGSNNTIDQTMIMKGKRTKRQRPLSPVGRASSSSGGGGGGRGGESGCSDDHHYNFSVPSVGEIYSSSTTDQEEEDMAANCLILLAQGRCGRIKQQEEEEDEIKMEKLISSRKVNEMVTTTSATATAATAAAAAKSGFYVYECKTCNRTFPSFQALGGHRASHKKPKPSTAAEEKKVAGIEGEEGELAEVEESSEEEEKGKQSTIIARAAPNSNSNPNPNDHHSSQLNMDQIPFSNKLISSHGNNNNKSSKIHECSICGSEFSSGQALGGHMRRHRNPTTTTKPTSDHHLVKKPSSSNTIFPLDLNLPAPPEDHDHRDLKFQYATNQQPHLVFSAPALVDCHY